MDLIVFLDSEPLGLASQQKGKPKADACRAWLRSIEAYGVQIFIPEIVDYEVRRELVRVGAIAGLRRLDLLPVSYPLLPLNRESLLKAAELLGLGAARPASRQPIRTPSTPMRSWRPRHSRRSVPGTSRQSHHRQHIGHLSRFPGASMPERLGKNSTSTADSARPILTAWKEGQGYVLLTCGQKRPERRRARDRIGAFMQAESALVSLCVSYFFGGGFPRQRDPTSGERHVGCPVPEPVSQRHPGRACHSSMVNVLWGMFWNLVVAYILLVHALATLRAATDETTWLSCRARGLALGTPART